MLLLKISVKKLVIQLEKHINARFPEYQPKFYSNRRNFFIHIGLDNSIFGYKNFTKVLEEVDCFLNEKYQINLI